MHSDDIVAVDRWGNMAVICHSINCLMWGKTAIVVDGVSISDSASFLKKQMAATRPGDQVENPVEIGILAKAGAPVIAWASMGIGLHYQSTQTLLNIIEFGMNMEDAVNAPNLLAPISPADNPMSVTLRVVEGVFDQDILEACGFQFEPVSKEKIRFAQGLWVGVAKDPQTGELTAISPPYTNGWSVAN
ncbi:MAG: hypothetical protein AAGC95_07415 [Pseudomonadota bacterium]